jgi:hypothetical protein
MSNWNLRNATVLIVLSILLLITILFTVFYRLFFYGCFWWDCAPTRNFSLLDLDLPVSLFPPNAETEGLHHIRNDLSVDPVVASFLWHSGTASYSIRRFPTTSKASVEYKFQINSRIFTTSIEPNNDVSDILKHKSNTADESNIRCGYVLTDFRCLFVARYQEFTIDFNSTIEAQGMTNNNYLNILKYIDNKMAELLKGSE